MGDKVRTLDYYEFDCDSTMVKKDENYKDETFEISKAMEHQNRKYIKGYEENEEETSEENNG